MCNHTQVVSSQRLHTHTHARTHTHTIKPPTAGVQLVGHTSIKQVELYAKFSMQPKADMVPNKFGFNQSETSSCLCARVACRFPGLPAMAKDGELMQTQ